MKQLNLVVMRGIVMTLSNTTQSQEVRDYYVWYEKSCLLAVQPLQREVRGYD